MARRPSGDGVPVEKKLERLARDEPLPFYVLFGKERYFIRKALSTLKQRLLPRGEAQEWLQQSVYGPEVNGAGLADLARSVPIFEERQLVVVWDADKLREKEQEAIRGYAEDPAPFTCMVFIGGAEAPKGKLFSFVKERCPGGFLEFAVVKRAECLRWMNRIAEEKGLGRWARPDLLEALLAGGQESLENLENRIEILALYTRDLEGGRIADPLPFGCPDISLEQAYRLTDPLLQGELPSVLEILNRFIGQGVSPLMLLARITGELRKLWQIKEEMERGPVTDAYLKSIHVQPFKKTMYASLARRLSWKSLGRLFFASGETDRLLKSSRLDPRFHLEALCEGIARAAAVREKA